MFPDIAEELEREIWKAFWSRYILREIRSHEPIWLDPSNNLLYGSSDLGALQHKYTDLERTYFHRTCVWPYLRADVYDSCFLGFCNDCVIRGFPCNDAIYCGGMNKKLKEFWDMSFYKNLLDEDEEFYLGIEYI